jgi:hypothetical protein
MPRRRTSARPEDQIQRAVFQHIRSRGVPGLVAWHTPNGGKRKPIEAAIFKGLGVRAGVSDIIAVHKGAVFALELKADGGRATESQLEFLADIGRAGAFTALATGIDQALTTLEAWGLLLGAAQLRAPASKGTSGRSPSEPTGPAVSPGAVQSGASGEGTEAAQQFDRVTLRPCA